jgi:hypothetical protein
MQEDSFMGKVIGSAGMGLLLLCVFSTLQAQEVKVRVSPASIPGMEHEHTHNIAPAALKSGATEFHIGGNPEDIHDIKLSKTQVQNLLNGTTVIVDTELDAPGGLSAHVHRLTITTIKVAPQQQESSGW